MTKQNEEQLDPIDAEAELQSLAASGAKVQAFTVGASSGADLLRGLVSMFDEASSRSTDNPEELAAWWRSFVIEAHLIGLERIGMGEAMQSFRGIALIIAQRISASQTRAN